MPSETKTCPRCWELSPSDARTCAACRYPFEEKTARPLPPPAQPKSGFLRFWPFSRTTSHL